MYRGRAWLLATMVFVVLTASCGRSKGGSYVTFGPPESSQSSGGGSSSGGSSSKTLPGSLYGTWAGGTNALKSIRFSSGGRVELNDGQCAGEYRISAVDGNKGSVRSGYIDCGTIMNGYFTVTVVVNGNALNMSGDFNGTYKRA